MHRLPDSARPRPGILLSLILTPLLAGCSADPPTIDATDASTPLVEAVPARSGSLPLAERLSGVVEAQNQVAVRPEISGPITEVLVRDGDRVTKGQPLVRLDDGTLREQLRQAEAGVRVAEATARSAQARVAELEARVVRSRKLAEDDLVSDLDLETLEARLAAGEAEADEESARVEAARAQADERRRALDKATVRAPVAGRVGARRAEPGMVVDPGTTLFRVGNFDRVLIEVVLSEDMLGYLAEGQKVVVRTGKHTGKHTGQLAHNVADGVIEAKLSRISPFLAEDSFSTRAEIDLDNTDGRLKPGMFVTVDVLYGETEQATLVPSSALWEDPRSGEQRVFVLDAPSDTDAAADESMPRPVRIREGVEILAEGRGVVGLRGVEPGEWVVTLGQHLISGDDDAAVRVREVPWEQVQRLQSTQREDLLAGHMAKQRRLAAALGAEPPTNEQYMRPGGVDESPGPAEPTDSGSARSEG